MSTTQWEALLSTACHAVDNMCTFLWDDCLNSLSYVCLQWSHGVRVTLVHVVLEEHPRGRNLEGFRQSSEVPTALELCGWWDTEFPNFPWGQATVTRLVHGGALSCPCHQGPCSLCLRSAKWCMPSWHQIRFDIYHPLQYEDNIKFAIMNDVIKVIFGNFESRVQFDVNKVY